MKIESINGFSIGDAVRIITGDGRIHIIKSFEIDGLKELFCEVYFEDGDSAMLNNIAHIDHTEYNSIAYLEQLGYTCVPPYCKDMISGKVYKSNMSNDGSLCIKSDLIRYSNLKVGDNVKLLIIK